MLIHSIQYDGSGRAVWNDIIQILYCLFSNIASQKELEEPKASPIKIQYKDNENVQSLVSVQWYLYCIMSRKFLYLPLIVYEKLF